MIPFCPATVYRSPYANLGGISDYFRELFIYCPDGSRCEEFDPAVSIPVNFCMAFSRLAYNDVVIVPATVDEDGRVMPRFREYMWGGNIAYFSRSDSVAGVKYPLRICDSRPVEPMPREFRL